MRDRSVPLGPEQIAIEAALMRVLGQPRRAELRSDTPLAAIGVDDLARLLIVDACCDAGYELSADAAWSAVTVGDLSTALAERPDEPDEEVNR